MSTLERATTFSVTDEAPRYTLASVIAALLLNLTVFLNVFVLQGM